MDITPDLLEKIKNLCEVYKKAKAVILVAEEYDEPTKSNLQITKQLKDAFDHLMQAINDSYTESKSKTDPIENVEKAIGHVFRASFDAIDGAAMSIIERYRKITNAYPSYVKMEAIPDFNIIEITIFEIESKIAEHRSKKTEENHDAEVFEEYLKTLNTVKEIYKTVVNSQVLMKNIYLEKVMEKKKTSLKEILIGLFLVVVGILLGLFLNSYN